MPFTRQPQTKTYNFLVTETLDNGTVKSKKYFSKSDVRKDYDMHDMMIHRMMVNADYRPKNFQNVKVIRIKEPARTVTYH